VTSTQTGKVSVGRRTTLSSQSSYTRVILALKVTFDSFVPMETRSAEMMESASQWGTTEIAHNPPIANLINIVIWASALISKRSVTIVSIGMSAADRQLVSSIIRDLFRVFVLNI
jgi:hypothetical protein